MKPKRVITLMFSLILASFGALATNVFAWLRPLERIYLDSAQGTTDNTAYYAGGKGTEEKPYIINSPIHLYNLAWLQYLGNYPTKNYFVVEADLDMEGYVLPPIGTGKYPFVSSFDGGEHIIANLQVSNAIGQNDGQIKKYPVGVSSTNFADCEIVGFFGLVGDKNTSYTTSSVAPEVKNFYLDQVTINTETSSTLAGIGVGYVNGEVSGVGISNSEIKFNNSSATKLDASITNNLSDYTLVGYCKDKYKNTTTVTDITGYTPTFEYKTFNYEGPNGTEQGGGGSIPMDKIYSRVLSIGYTNGRQPSNNQYYYSRTNLTKADGTIVENYEQSTTNYVRLYNSNFNQNGYNKEWGSFVFNYRTGSFSNSEQYLFLAGGQTVTEKHIEETTKPGYLISIGSNYLTANTSYNGFVNSTSAENATVWFATTSSFTNNSTRFYTTDSNGTQYFIGLSANSNNALTLDEEPAYDLTWRNGDRLVYTRNIIFTTTNRYLRFDGTTWTLIDNTNTPAEIDLTFTSKDATFNTLVTDNEYVDYSVKNVTYFPLSIKNQDTRDFAPAANNSGYIISGADDQQRYDNATNAWPRGSGDIRISYYARNTYLSGSWKNNSLSDVYTINNSNNQSSHLITEAEAQNFEKYAKTKAAMQATLSSSTNVYGLHFMNAEINMKNMVTADWVSINEQESTNYQLPANCIDFNLKEQGWVNFFGGTYYSGNNSFFSLHKIERNSTNRITAIREIEEIFWDRNESHEVVYKFANDEYSIAHTVVRGVPTNTVVTGSSETALPSNYQSVFKTEWIKLRTDLTNRAAYYFEFPMNVGEFALGSVSGATGAYLMYLDIAANAQKISESTVAEKWIEQTKTYVSPFGIALVSVAGIEDASVSDHDAVIAFAIKSYVDKVGVSFVASGEDNTTTTVVCSDLSKLDFGYKSENTTLQDESGNEITNITPKTTSAETIHTRITHYDYNIATGDTVITTILDGVKTVVKIDIDGNSKEFIDGEQAYYSDLDKHNNSLVASDSLLFKVSYRYINESDTSMTVACTVTIDLDDDYAEGSEVDKIKVLSGYTFTLTVNNGDGLPNVTARIIQVNGEYVLQIIDSEGNVLAETTQP